jgi:hypothetical protein
MRINRPVIMVLLAVMNVFIMVPYAVSLHFHRLDAGGNGNDNAPGMGFN